MPLKRLRRLLEEERYRDAQLEGERLIRAGTLTPEELATAYKGTAMASYYRREIYAAIKLGEYALEVAERTSNWELINKCHYDLGEYYLTLGDYPQAYDHLMKCLHELHRTPYLVDVEAGTHHKLALLFRYRRQYEDAIGAHHLSLDLLRQCGNWPLLMEALRGLVYCYLALDQPEEALPYLEQLERYLAEHPNDQVAASLLTDWAYYYQKMGDLRQSMVFCTRAMAPGLPGQDENVLSTASVIAGENALALGRYDEAQLFANLAMQYALESRQSALMNRALALQRKLHELGHARP
nr:MAG: hypothetical protein DIU55_03135 [Bacillota bacterium]